MDIPEVPQFIFAPSRVFTMSSPNNPDEEQGRNVRQRCVNAYGLVPRQNNVRLPDTMVEVDIQHMMTEKPERKKAIMYLQLIRVVSGNTGQKTCLPTSLTSRTRTRIILQLLPITTDCSFFMM